MKIEIDRDELIGCKTVARQLPQLLCKLDNGDLEKIVVMRHSDAVAVILTIESYEALVATLEGGNDA